MSTFQLLSNTLGYYQVAYPIPDVIFRIKQAGEINC